MSGGGELRGRSGTYPGPSAALVAKHYRDRILFSRKPAWTSGNLCLVRREHDWLSVGIQIVLGVWDGLSTMHIPIVQAAARCDQPVRDQHLQSCSPGLHQHISCGHCCILALAARLQSWFDRQEYW